MNKAFFIYGKNKDMKRFQAVGRNDFVHKLFYAVMYENREDAYGDMVKLRKINPDITFEVRGR